MTFIELIQRECRKFEETYLSTIPWSKSIKSSPNGLLTFDVRLCTTFALSFFAGLDWVPSPIMLAGTWLICRGGSVGAMPALNNESFEVIKFVPNDAFNCV